MLNMQADVLLYWPKALGQHFCHAKWGTIPCIPKKFPDIELLKSAFLN